jgi:NOL1/NOP2/sun family putative RNA methylase
MSKHSDQTMDMSQRLSAYQPLMGNHWDQFCQIIQEPLPQTFWINPQRTSVDSIKSSFCASQIDLMDIPWIPGAFRLKAKSSFKDKSDKLGRRFEFRTGQLHLQEEVSMLPVLALNPQKDESILDLCAAPGGKTAQIALMMGGQGTVIANDKSFGRLRALRSTQERLGLFNLALSAWDGQQLWHKSRGIFDRVLADVPCSCEGTVRKTGTLGYEQEDTTYRKHLHQTQKQLLLQALQLVKVGGTVVYSTCTFDPDENEAVLAHAFQKYGDLIELLPMDFPGLVYEKGLSAWQGQHYGVDLSLAMRIYPHHNDTGGFFIACLRKKGDLPAVLMKTTVPTQDDFHIVPKASLNRVLDHEQRLQLFDQLFKRYGIAREDLEGFHYYQNTSRYISAISKNHRVLDGGLDQELETGGAIGGDAGLGAHLEASGVPIVNLSGHTIQLTSASAMAFASAIHKQYIELETQDQVDLYYQGASFELSKNQKVGGTGTTVVKYGKYALGMAIIRDVDNRVWVESNYPKASQLAAHASAFE